MTVLASQTMSLPLATGHGGPSSLLSSHGNMLQFLQEAFTHYNRVSESNDYDTSKQLLAELQNALQSKGIYGIQAVQLLSTLSQQINWQDMNPLQFTRFYRFAFHLFREPGRRNVQVDVAIQGWQVLLRGRFRLLHKFTSFVALCNKAVIVEDTWRQVLDFCGSIHEDLSNYDASGAWPVLLDEFVEHQRQQQRLRNRVPQNMDSDFYLHEVVSPAIQPMSPACGSKRRAPDIDVVVDQLQHMPLVSSGDEVSEARSPSMKRCRMGDHVMEDGVGIEEVPAAGWSWPSGASPVMGAGPGHCHTPPTANRQPRRMFRTKSASMQAVMQAVVKDALGLDV